MTAFTILVKELRAYFGLFLAYAMTAVALGLSGFFFYTDLSFFMLWGGTDLEMGLWQYLFHDLRFVLLLLVPVLTARLFAEEKKLGTLDLLWTYPVSEASVLAGKFLSACFLVALVLGLTAFYPLLLSSYYPAVTWGPIAAGFVGLLLLSMVFIAVGLFLSSLTDNQAVAAMGTFGVIVLFWFLTWNEQAMDEVLLRFLLQVSLFDRFYNFARGVIESREVTFFVLFALFFLLLTWQSLRSRRWRGAGEFSSFRAFWTTPSRRQWLAMAVVDVAVVAGLVFLQSLSEIGNQRWDLSQAQKFTLSPQTRDLLRDLDRDLSVTLFFGGRPDIYQDYEDLLRQYEGETPRFRYHILYRDRNLALAQQYGAKYYGSSVVEYDGQQKVIALPTEELITQAIFQLVHTHEKVIYFVSGHGEHDPQSADPQTGYSALRAALENERFVVRNLELVKTRRVPDDATLIVISGPQIDLLEEEVGELERHLAGGGRLLVMVDPVGAPRLAAFLARYGVTLAEDVVYDPENRLFGGDPLSPLVSLYNTSHPIVRDFNVNTLFSLARSVEPTSENERRFSVVPFCRTGPGSWARFRAGADLPEETVDYEGTKARSGPISVAVASTPGSDGGEKESRPGARVVVFGDSDFVGNGLVSLLGNKDLFLNTVEWLVGEETRITQRPPDRETQPKLSPVYLTAKQAQRVFWLSVIGQPGAVLLAGALVAVYRRRRRR